jgi:RNA polymerase sigma-70 factor (ECF subfamily)
MNIETLYRDYYKKLLSFVIYRIRDKDGAEDIVQQTFLQAMPALASFRGEAQLYTWLCEIAINVIKNKWRKEKRWQTEEFVEHEDFNPSPLDILLLKEQLNSVSVALRNDKLRGNIMWLHAVEEKKYEEIALELGLPIGTVRSRLNRIRNQLVESCN